MNTQTLKQVMTKLGADYLPTDEPTSKSLCWIAPVVFDDEQNPTAVMSAKLEGLDIYQLLEKVNGGFTENYKALAFLTVGWASPVGDDDDDTMPSAHPLRKRVALICLTTKQGKFGSVMKMWGNDEVLEPLVECENGSGMLRDAALGVW